MEMKNNEIIIVLIVTFTCEVFGIANLASRLDNAEVSHFDLDSKEFSDDIGRSNKSSKAMSVFTVLNFENTECTGGNGLAGTCYTHKQCFFGATNSAKAGYCASGYGVCCTAQIECGGKSKLNNTHLISPNYPSTFDYDVTCEHTIKIDSSICQLRLDITTLDLNYPNSYGQCLNDFLTVSQDRKFNRICGVTRDTHFYLDVDASVSTAVVFKFQTDRKSFPRKWDLKVAKIMCSSAEEVPNGCGQYFTGTTGIIKGFNNDAPSTDFYYLTDLNYNVCVRMELGYCEATYTSRYDLYWLPACNDIWEIPTNVPNRGAINPRKCSDATLQSTGTPNSLTISQVAPHYFYFDTTADELNEHIISQSPLDGYYFTFTQIQC